MSYIQGPANGLNVPNGPTIAALVAASGAFSLHVEKERHYSAIVPYQPRKNGPGTPDSANAVLFFTLPKYLENAAYGLLLPENLPPVHPLPPGSSLNLGNGRNIPVGNGFPTGNSPLEIAIQRAMILTMNRQEEWYQPGH